MNLKPLLTWSQSEFKKLPWREDRSLYRTLVSEIMLQQTTVGTVKNHFERFLKTYPTLESLASSSEENLLIAWKGLGYYRRARSLKKIAEALARDHQGNFPQDKDALQEISGIGPYTANALLSIGMDLPALALDANLERVISRLYNIKMLKGPKLQKEIDRLFTQKEIFKDRKISFRALNEALMDLGRTFCQARKVSCELCPLKNDCLSFKSGEPLKLPLIQELKGKSAEKHELKVLRVYVIKNKKLMVYKKEASEWLSGQNEVPTFILTSTDKNLSQYPRDIKNHKKYQTKSFKTGITKYAIENFIHECSDLEFKQFNFSKKVLWVDPESPLANLSTATLKGLKKLKHN